MQTWCVVLCILFSSKTKPRNYAKGVFETKFANVLRDRPELLQLVTKSQGQNPDSARTSAFSSTPLIYNLMKQ